MVSQVLIGSDPEAFVQQGGVIHHCINILGGTKDAPRFVRDGAVQEDNVLFEFNTDPTDDPVVFCERVQAVLDQGRDILLFAGLKLRERLSSHVYGAEMDFFPEKAFEFGCTPDYNAFTGAVNPRPEATEQRLRTAGGHVHIGYSHLTTVTESNQRAVINLCDYLLGLPSLLEDTDSRRRELYGKAGACRFKSYGVEYRTLSNYWIWDAGLTSAIHARAQEAFDKHERIELYQALIPQAEVQRVINNNDVAEARAMLEILRHASI
jgi:hypothetical protein